MSETYDLTAPGVAARLGEDLARDMLRLVGHQIMHAPPDARLQFFQAYLAMLTGGMAAALGAQAAREAIALVEDAIFDARPPRPGTVH